MTTDDMEIVSALRLALADKVGNERFELWFGPGTRLALAAESLLVRASSRFKLDWLRRHFRSDLEAVCAEVLGRQVAIDFRVDPSLPEKASPPASDAGGKNARHRVVPKSAEDQPPARGTGRRRFADLDSFVVGESNRLAHTSAVTAARRPGRMSPLFVYGPPGVGKTHLLEGIWTEARRRRVRRMVYLSAEQFTTYFLEALNGSGLPSFRRKYRDLQLLIIDDVQFFAGKRATLVELLHTIDTVLRHGGQLVFSATRPPAKLPALGPELTTRMAAGLVCGLDQPEMPTRLAIARQMARQRGLDVPRNVLELIATHLIGDARRISGAICRLRATAEALGQPITLTLAEEALGEMFRAGNHAVRLADVERAVCDVLGLEPKTLKSTRKGKRVSYPRMLAMWLARKHTRVALSEISHFFGRRSHTSVISAQKKVGAWMASGDPLELAGRSWKVEDAIRQIEGRLRTG